MENAVFHFLVILRNMLAPRALQAEASTPAQPRRRVSDQTRWALSHLGQALLGCALEAVAYSVGLDGPGSLPRPTSQASATSSGNMVVAPTDNTKLYRDYLNGNLKPELDPLRSVPFPLAVEPSIGIPDDGPSPGGTGGSTQGQGQDEIVEASYRRNGEGKVAEEEPGKHGGWRLVNGEGGRLCEGLCRSGGEDGTVALLTGKAMEFPSPAKRTHLRPSSRPSCGLQVAESETRFKSNHFPTKDTREEWVQAAQNYKKGAEQMLAFYQRSQLASRLMRGVWAPSRCRDHGVEALFASYCGKVAGVPGAGLADFVV